MSVWFVLNHVYVDQMISECHRKIGELLRVSRKRLVVNHGRAAAAATSESGLGPGSTLTGILSHFGAKLRDWADRQAEAGCYSLAVLSSNDLKTRYTDLG